MARFGDFKETLVWVGFLAVVLTGGVRNARADFTFGQPQNLGPNINSSSVEIDPSISADGLELFFESRRPGGHGLADIYVSRRASKDDPWGPCMNIGAPVNTAYWEQSPSISADGLSLYFSNWRVYGRDELWVTTRASVSDPWAPPVNLGATVNSSADDWDWAPSISADGLSLYFASNRAGGRGGDDLWFTSRAPKNDPWGSPVNLGATVNSSLEECFPDISADGRMLFFSDHGLVKPWRAGGLGGCDIWVTARATTNEPWGEPRNLGPVNSSDHDLSPNVSADGSTLYFCSDRPGGIGSADLWQAPIMPIVDFDGDEIVDISDLVILIEHWGQNEPSVDIGPVLWGDGVVDAADLEVLMSYWQQEILDPALAAYWKLDEAEGSIAQNSVSDNDGILHGEPLWQPAGGRKAGALAFDGIDDYVSTDFVLNPLDGAFSVLAWIKGGAPGDVVISQTDGIGGSGETWLGTEPSSGKFMSGLVPPAVGRFIPQPLKSESVITDGQWHRVGFVWDGSYRSLYVDGVEVAKDTTAQNPLKSATGGLYIGAGKTLDAATFFSGLIDDVRIYNRAVSP
jgi:Tol biopolymer transport system component